MKTSVRLLALAALCLARPAQALTEAELSAVGASPRIGARLPLEARFRDDSGRPLTLGRALGGKPAMLVFADYRCTSLCGPGLVIAALALDRSGLNPQDYSFVVVGLDAADPPALAARVREARLRGAAGRAAILLGGGPAGDVARAAGYRYLFDPAAGQFVHDTVAYAVDRDGRVRRALSEFTLDPGELRTALTAEAPARPASPWAQVRLLCHGLIADTGRWNASVLGGLKLGGLALLAALGLGLAIFATKTRRAS
jgi:protein SCO1/2